MPEIRIDEKSIWVYIKLEGEGFADSEEFDLRSTLEEAIEEAGVGDWEGSGSGGGWMDFSFGVANLNGVEEALTVIKKLLGKYQIPDEFVRLEIHGRTDQICDELPDFQPGDCLSYRFEDGDFGAALVLKPKHDESNTSGWQTGIPPSSNQAAETLLGILDYKLPNQPPKSVFEQRKWLTRTHESSKGQPLLIWVNCFGGIEIEIIYRVTLTADDLMDCRFHLPWEEISECFIRDKYRGNKALNPYERIGDDFPVFQPGDCLIYRFEDGDFGAVLVLKSSNDDPNNDDTLLGILDYKQPNPPQRETFEQRNWLISGETWRTGQPYLIWAKYCWAPRCAHVDFEAVDHILLKAVDPTTCQVGIFWLDIPEHVLHEMNRGK